MAPKGSRKGNDTMTKTTYKVGDKVRVLNAASIMFGRTYFSDGAITTVIGINESGSPRIKTKASDQYGLVIMSHELPYIEKVEEVKVGETVTKYAVGDKVRILNVSRILYGSQYFNNGDITTVKETRANGEKPVLNVIDRTGNSGGLYIMGRELPFIEKVEGFVQPIEVTTMPTRISQLESQVAKLESKVQTLESDKSRSAKIEMTAGVFSADLGRSFVRPTYNTNQLRAAAIEQAKQFVEDVTARMAGGRINHEGNATFRHRTTKPYFTTKGRTVSVVVRGTGLPTEYERASATCAEGDVFNEDIGRAIALGRAMGLVVSTVFTKAPQPSQVVVGMEVTTLYLDGTVNEWCPTTVTNIRSDGKPGFGNGSRSSIYKIAEDTNAQYEKGAK